MVDGKEYMKIGWNEYEANPALGYGWYGDMAHVEYSIFEQRAPTSYRRA